MLDMFGDLAGIKTAGWIWEKLCWSKNGHQSGIVVDKYEWEPQIQGIFAIGEIALYKNQIDIWSCGTWSYENGWRLP